MIEAIWIFLLIILVLVVLILVLLHRYQEVLIFFPEKLPQQYQYRFEDDYEAEELTIHVKKNVDLNALLFKVPNPKGLILYFHGNSGSLRTWGEVAPDFTKWGYDLLIYDFRGYGKSTGRIRKEQMLHQEAEVVYQEMAKRYQAEDIHFYGRSLGTGIAAKLAITHRPKQLLLETPYYNFRDVADHHYFFLPTSLILSYQFRTNKFLTQLGCPVFLIHGTEDEVVPHHSSERLAELGDHVHLTTIEHGTHSDLAAYDQFHDWLKDRLT